MPKEKVKEKVRPVHEIRLGRIKAAIWVNELPNDRGRVFHATLGRIYHDGRQWHDSSSFGRDDLPLVMKVADRVHSWIFEQNQEHNGSHKQDQNSSSSEDF